MPKRDCPEAQGRLMTARETWMRSARSAAEARAAHAAMIERASALVAEVARLEEAARDVEGRSRCARCRSSSSSERSAKALDAGDCRRHTPRLTTTFARLDALREDVRQADQAAADVRSRVDGHDAVIREARQTLEQIRAQAGELDVARATAQSDLAHLAQLCEETIQSSLDADSVGRRADGAGGRDDARRRRVIAAEEPDPEAEQEATDAEPDVVSGFSRTAGDRRRLAPTPAVPA